MDTFYKISPAPLYQRGVIPPFGKGRSGGIFGERLDNYETVNNMADKDISGGIP
jgi:hypothetical protein